MNSTSAGWTMFIGAIGMMASLMAGDLQKLSNWHDATTPAFVALMMAHLGVVVMAFIGGKIIPADRDPNAHTRTGDPKA